MEQYSALFLGFISSWGYLAIALLMGLENACIPIPSELILGFAGYLVFMGKLTFTGTIIAGMIGGMIGSIITYYIGHFGGRPFIDKYGKYFFMKKSHIDTAQRWFDKYGIKAVFFSRMLPVVRTFISLPAGFAGINMKKFIIFTFAGSLPWTILIIYVGKILGENWIKMLSIGHEFSLLICILIVLCIIFFYIRHLRKKNNSN